MNPRIRFVFFYAADYLMIGVCKTDLDLEINISQLIQIAEACQYKFNTDALLEVSGEDYVEECTRTREVFYGIN